MFSKTLTPFLLLSSLCSSSFALKTCVVPSKYKCSNGTASDSPAIAKAFADCSKDAVIEFREGVEYNVFTPIKATNLSNVVISLKGNLNLPQDIPAVQSIVAAGGGSIHWFEFAGENVQLLGSSNITTGWIRSYGQAWWDANPPGGTGLEGRPHLMRFNVQNGIIKHYKASKPVAWNLSVKGKNITITDTIVDAESETSSFPFNTDGIGVGATDVIVKNSVIYNGDDAIAVTDGAKNVLFQGGTIGYQSHGMSIGSLGKDQTAFVEVSNIKFDDITVVSAVYASRFKSWMGGQGLVSNVTWSNIRLYNVTFPIFVTQTYFDQNNNDGPARPNNSSVNMESFTWENWAGTINTFNPGDGSCVTDPCWYDVGLPNLKHTEALIIECNSESSCKNFALKNMRVYPQNLAPATQICMNAVEALNPDLGIHCKNGTFIPLS